ncbi:hypothetical protein HUT18_09460 [Streptomyces sp. NA04227]|uniref:hypothetical protein n=1 Tax=Streptomyces sp. NA04227 TaxID=2742136 RepID=UPI00158FE6F8|nr:hypothetical protein [Streptomyces sp. NA04227]QKW06597.1 hypothetical protein HUT18_09460 [Streptomyces sp. NA04227]
MTPTETSRFVRLRVELVVEIADPEAVTGAAMQRIADDAAVRGDDMARSEREHAESAVQEDEAEALAYLVDPYDLVSEVPGVELAQASWSSERIDYDPDSPDWDLDEEDDAEHVTEGADGR